MGELVCEYFFFRSLFQLSIVFRCINKMNSKQKITISSIIIYLILIFVFFYFSYRNKNSGDCGSSYNQGFCVQFCSGEFSDEFIKKNFDNEKILEMSYSKVIRGEPDCIGGARDNGIFFDNNKNESIFTLVSFLYLN